MRSAGRGTAAVRFTFGAPFFRIRKKQNGGVEMARERGQMQQEEKGSLPVFHGASLSAAKLPSRYRFLKMTSRTRPGRLDARGLLVRHSGLEVSPRKDRQGGNRRKARAAEGSGSLTRG